VKDAATLVRECRSKGVTLTLVAGRVRLRAKKPLSGDLMSALRDRKQEVIALLSKEQETDSGCWVLDEWRRVSIPDWRRILQKSIAQGNNRRADYARWMLLEVLEDPDFKDPKL